ncbi:hypothetical protein EDD27_4073 [Nonomuraea polychroma]|uniref:Uncharacterized protein n=1 Tax=Nonomuraea polychroma TaxID=46176 RepID=A0A438M752_9ACTN|nr:hypothetical protein EDD27_4073 [Nonomuraea polychroma]
MQDLERKPVQLLSPAISDITMPIMKIAQVISANMNQT